VQVRDRQEWFAGLQEYSGTYSDGSPAASVSGESRSLSLVVVFLAFCLRYGLPSRDLWQKRKPLLSDDREGADRINYGTETYGIWRTNPNCRGHRVTERSWGLVYTVRTSWIGLTLQGLRCFDQSLRRREISIGSSPLARCPLGESRISLRPM